MNKKIWEVTIVGSNLSMKHDWHGARIIKNGGTSNMVKHQSTGALTSKMVRSVDGVSKMTIRQWSMILQWLTRSAADSRFVSPECTVFRNSSILTFWMPRKNERMVYLNCLNEFRRCSKILQSHGSSQALQVEVPWISKYHEGCLDPIKLTCQVKQMVNVWKKLCGNCM